jgi:hypothetical protein
MTLNDMENMEEKEYKFVLIIDGKRVSGLLSEDDAKKEATKHKPTQESEKGCQPKVEVKQNLFG